MHSDTHFFFTFSQYTSKFDYDSVSYSIRMVSGLVQELNQPKLVVECLSTHYGYAEYLRVGLEQRKEAVKNQQKAVVKILTALEVALRNHKVTDMRIVNALLKYGTPINRFFITYNLSKFRILAPRYRNPYSDLRNFSVGKKPDQIIFFANSMRSVTAIEMLAGVREFDIPKTVLFAPHQLKKPFTRKVYHYLRKRINLLIQPKNVKFLDVIQRKRGMPTTIADACVEYGAEFKKISSFSVAEIKQSLEVTSGTLAVFVGSTILPRSSIELFKGAVLHYHPGRLPFVRGVETIEWPLLLKMPQDVGYTIQFMNAGLDSGAVIESNSCGIAQTSNLSELRSHVQFDGIQREVEILKNIVTDGFCESKLPRFLSPALFVMAPALFRIANKNYLQAKKQSNETTSTDI